MRDKETIVSLLDPCGVDGCERKRYARGYCNMHYERVRSGRDVGGAERETGPRRHGTCSMYQTGCRCEPCRAGYSEYYREYRKRKPPSYERQRGYNLKSKFGITLAQYNEMLLAQGGRCAICRSVDPQSARSGNFAVDHDHQSGKVRGLLCVPCNVGIGHLGESRSTLESAIAYLERSRA